MEIKYWFDQSERKLVVIHCPSGERREIKKTNEIERFLEAHGVTLEECKGVREDTDRLHLFKKMMVWKSRS